MFYSYSLYSPTLPRFTTSFLHPCSFVSLFLSHQDQIVCPNILGCVVIHWSVFNLTEAIHIPRENWLSLSQQVTIDNTFSVQGCPAPLSILRLGLAGAHMDFVHAVPTALSSCVQLPQSRKHWFLLAMHHLWLLRSFFFLLLWNDPSLNLERTDYGVYVPFMSDHSAVAHSLAF